MSETRARAPFLLTAVAGALVAAVALAGCSSDGDSEAEPVATPGAATTTAPPAATEPSTVPTQETPEEFCDSFLTFVDANSEYGADLDATSGQALVEAARTMFEMPTPAGLSAGGRVSLDELVQGTLAQLEGVPGVTVDASPAPDHAGEPDPTAMDAYLQETCPA